MSESSVYMTDIQLGQGLVTHLILNDRACAAADVLAPATFAAIQSEVRALMATERSYLPVHKKGSTIGYQSLREAAPSITALYNSKVFQTYLSNLAGVRLTPTPFHDESSLSVLFYEKPGDHINWHYDHNFYIGRHFTALIGIENTNSTRDGVSSAALRVLHSGEVVTIPTPPNSLVFYEGKHLLHKVTPLEINERRTILSLTYCTDPRNTWLQEMQRRIKDTAFFGSRVLWS